MKCFLCIFFCKKISMLILLLFCLVEWVEVMVKKNQTNMPSSAHKQCLVSEIWGEQLHGLVTKFDATSRQGVCSVCQ